MEELPRQRVLRALEHKAPRRVPFSWGFGPTGEEQAALDAYLARFGANFDDLERATCDIRYAGARYLGPKFPERTDMWGIRRRPVSYGFGVYDEFEHFPLAGVETVSAVENYPWPKPEWFDFSRIADDIRSTGENGRYAIRAGGGNPFEIFCWMTGLEESLVKLLELPEVVSAALDRITDFFCRMCRSMLDAAHGGIDLVFTADDLGGQHGLLMSRQTYRKILMPFHRRLHDTIHAYEGPRTLYHSDGSVVDLLDDLIEAGVDILEAVQVDADGMAPEGLKMRFGDRLSFHGGVSVQQLLPRATSDEVRQEVARLKRVFGAGGGYICAPAHAIQALTPPENVIAMVEEAVEQPLAALLKRSK